MSARGPSDRDFALECLKLAITASPIVTDCKSVLSVAERFYAFVSGDAPVSVRAQIIAALDAADVS